MMKAVNLLDNSGEQSLSIPKELRLNDDKVYLKKVGNALFIIPFHTPWQSLFDSLDSFTPDFLDSRPDQSQQRTFSFD